MTFIQEDSDPSIREPTNISQNPLQVCCIFETSTFSILRIDSPPKRWIIWILETTILRFHKNPGTKKSSSTAQNRKRKPFFGKEASAQKKKTCGEELLMLSPNFFFPCLDVEGCAGMWRLLQTSLLDSKDVISKKQRNTTSERKDQKQERLQRSCLPLRVFETRVSLLLPSDRETQQDLCIWSQNKFRRGSLNGWKDVWKRCFIKDFVYFAAQYEHVKFLGFYHWKKICVSRCFRSSAVWKNF